MSDRVFTRPVAGETAMDGQRSRDFETPQARSGSMSPGLGAGDAIAASVGSVVTDTIIPHLLLRCRAGVAPREVTQVHVDTLARLLLSRDGLAAGAQVTALSQGGFSTESLLHDLVTPAARRLGEFWHADSVDFVDVAMAMARLTSIVRGLCHGTGRDLSPTAPQALIATDASERHALGSLIVAQSFRASGWAVREMPGLDSQSLNAIVAADHYALVGLSIGSEMAVQPVCATIAALRDASLNDRLCVAVGGPAAVMHHALVESCGADFVTSDGREAVRLAKQHLLKSQSSESL